jgi:hypothetical protein
MELDAIGLKHGTDKASNSHDYLHLYQRRLAHLRDQAFVMIEVGVDRGGSVRMWSEYFPRATIVGIDLHDDCRQHEQGNISIRIGNASDPQFLFEVLREFGRPLVFLDDGSHRWDHQIRTLQIMFPILRPTGLYIVEDLDTSFQGRLAQAAYQGYSTISAFDYFGLLARRVVGDAMFDDEKPYDLFVNDYFNWIGGIEFARRTCVITKKATFGAGPT